MKVGDLVKYKDNAMSLNNPFRGKVFSVTLVLPSGNVRLKPWHDDEAHNSARLEVVSAKK